MTIPPGIKEANRRVLGRVPQWIDEMTWLKSCYGYGIPKRILPLVDLPWDYATTVSDFLVALALHWPDGVHYLEFQWERISVAWRLTKRFDR